MGGGVLLLRLFIFLSRVVGAMGGFERGGRNRSKLAMLDQKLRGMAPVSSDVTIPPNVGRL